MSNFVIGIDLTATDDASPVIEQAQSNLTQLDQLQGQNAASMDEASQAATRQKSAFSELGGQVTT